MEQNLRFLPLLLILMLAFMVPLILSRMRRLPVVVGEILAGILIGKSGLRLIREDFTLDFLAEVGLAFLMFLAGLEIDFSLFFSAARRRGRRIFPLILAAISFVFTLLLAGSLSWYLVQKGLARDPWMLALILSTTSLGVVVPVLKERGLSADLFGQTVLLAALMADFFTMFFITIYVAVKSLGLSLELLLVGVLFVVALLVYRIGIARTRRPALSRVMEEFSHASAQLKVQGALALLIGFVVLSNFLGTEMILGAFLAGVVFSLLTPAEDEQIRHKLDAIGFGFFVPIFFITVGMRFDFPALLRNKATWILTPLLLAAAFVIKIFPALLFRIFFPWRKTLGGGLILSARLSLIIAASGIGLRLGVIGEATNAAFILVAAVTSTLAPILFNWIIPLKEQKQTLPILIYGLNDLARQVARELERRGEKVNFIQLPAFPDSSKDGTGLPAAEDEKKVTSFEKQILQNARALLALDTDDGNNLWVCRKAIKSGLAHVIAMVHNPTQLPAFNELGGSADIYAGHVQGHSARPDGLQS